MKVRIKPGKEIRAIYDSKCIRVYQAFSPLIAIPTLKSGSLNTTHFKVDRMTWIKPSFLWMMYRSNWAKNNGQEYVLGIDITREGFEWALQNSCLSSYHPDNYDNIEDWKQKANEFPVRIQWDPERDLFLNKLDYRTIQIGLSKKAVISYIKDWIIKIEDVTPLCKEINNLIIENDISKAAELCPHETLYPLSQKIKNQIGIEC